MYTRSKQAEDNWKTIKFFRDDHNCQFTWMLFKIFSPLLWAPKNNIFNFSVGHVQTHRSGATQYHWIQLSQDTIISIWEASSVPERPAALSTEFMAACLVGWWDQAVVMGLTLSFEVSGNFWNLTIATILSACFRRYHNETCSTGVQLFWLANCQQFQKRLNSLSD